MSAPCHSHDSARCKLRAPTPTVIHVTLEASVPSCLPFWAGVGSRLQEWRARHHSAETRNTRGSQCHKRRWRKGSTRIFRLNCRSSVAEIVVANYAAENIVSEDASKGAAKSSSIVQLGRHYQKADGLRLVLCPPQSAVTSPQQLLLFKKLCTNGDT